MAKAVINLQKESGGIVKISPVDGTGVTEVTVPESGNLVSVDTAVTDNAIARFDSTTGKVQNSGVVIDDSGNLTTNATLKATRVSAATGSDSVTIGGWDTVNHRVEYLNRPLKITGYGTNSDIIFANNNDSEKMRIDSAGRVTMPYQPSFCVGDGQSVQGASIVMYQNVRHNVGGHYNVSNGRFTAPVTGVYHFECYIQPHTTAYATYSSIAWRINDGIIVTSELVEVWNGGSDHRIIGGSIALHMNAGDYMNVFASRGYRGIQGYMSGHLIG